MPPLVHLNDCLQYKFTVHLNLTNAKYWPTPVLYLSNIESVCSSYSGQFPLFVERIITASIKLKTMSLVRSVCDVSNILRLTNFSVALPKFLWLDQRFDEVVAGIAKTGAQTSAKRSSKWTTNVISGLTSTNSLSCCLELLAHLWVSFSLSTLQGVFGYVPKIA